MFHKKENLSVYKPMQVEYNWSLFIRNDFKDSESKYEIKHNVFMRYYSVKYPNDIGKYTSTNRDNKV